tara:strand:+ start:236 stop:484 length:249 start_codon:yes stop_codon:yes gene_type:complete
MSVMDKVNELQYNLNRSFEYMNEISEVENHNFNIFANILKDMNTVTIMMFIQILILIICQYYTANEIEKIQQQLKDKTTNKI